jgi:hypothetical protein
VKFLKRRKARQALEEMEANEGKFFVVVVAVSK